MEIQTSANLYSCPTCKSLMPEIASDKNQTNRASKYHCRNCDRNWQLVKGNTYFSRGDYLIEIAGGIY